MRASTCALSILFAVAALGAQDGLDCRAACAAAAAKITAISYDDLVYGRFGPAWAGFSRGAPGLAEFAALAARDDATADVLPLLNDPDPKLRTLALLLLFDREDPQLLPRIAALAGDPAATFPSVFQGSYPEAPSDPWVRAPRSVGQLAQQLIGFYYLHARYPHGIETTPGWLQYWQPRQQRDHCASWMLLWLERATGGVSPLQPGCTPRIAAVRHRVDALPPPDRQLMLLCLPDLDGAFATVAERLTAARALGAEALLDLLAGKFPSDDPDWPVLFADHGSGGCSFVLDHARELLTPAAAPRLLLLEQQQRQRARNTTGFVGAGWVVAAASLQPEHAEALLRAAFARFQEPFEVHQRAELLVGLHRYAGPAARSFLVEQFWQPLAALDSSPPARTALCQALAEDGTEPARATMRALLQHDGFAAAEAETLVQIARAINTWVEPDVIPAQALQLLGHPLGLQRLRLPEQLQQASAAHPAATAAMLATLQRWRRELLASVPRWALAAPK